jgi:hypothetical protein
MRLTLRTLLAWLDDMLPTHEVREIGNQVADSSYARELVERIRRVTRQRRLSVPLDDGQEVNDPNRVAEYLDNVLTPEQVAEFERTCLKSDVHLAEVASAHQILSLLGQKAKVPPDARYRMYHLIKGRETIGERAKRDHRDVRTEPVSAALPLSEPAADTGAWGPARSALIAAALVLGGLLAWSTWDNLRPLRVAQPESSLPIRVAERGAAQGRAPGPPASVPPMGVVGAPAPAANGGQRAPEGDGHLDPALAHAVEAGKAVASLPAEAEAAEVMVDDVAAAPGREEAAKTDSERVVPAGEIGSLKETDGVLLRRSGDGSPWERPGERAKLTVGDRLVNLDPYRSTLDLEPGELRLVRGVTLEIDEPAAETDDTVILRQGRIVARSGGATKALGFGLGSEVLRLEIPTGVPVGIERAADWTAGAGDRTDGRSGLAVYLPEGELQAALGGASQTFRGPAVIDVDATGKMTARSGEVMPDWVLERTPPALDSETGRQFARFFREDNPPLANLVEAASADRPDIRRLAFEALGQIGQFSVIVTALSAPEQVETRRAAIDVLRSALAQGGETSRDRLRQELERTGGVEWAELAEQLLVGLVKSAESDPQPALLKLLDHQDVGIRELALDNLMRLSNRGDSLGYNPDDPTPEQIRAWTELLQAPSGRGARGARP